MTQAELVQMLISKSNSQAETIKCLKIELEEAQAVARVHKSDMRVTVDALSAARGGYAVRKQNQGTVENLRLAVQSLLHVYGLNQNEHIVFARKIMSLTETEVSF